MDEEKENFLLELLDAVLMLPLFLTILLLFGIWCIVMLFLFLYLKFF